MTTPTTAEVAHGSKQEQIITCTDSPRRAAFMRFKPKQSSRCSWVAPQWGTVAQRTTPPTTEQALSSDLHDLR